MKPTTDNTTNSHLNIPNGGPECNERMPLLQQNSMEAAAAAQAQRAPTPTPRSPNHVPIRGGGQTLLHIPSFSLGGGTGASTPPTFTLPNMTSAGTGTGTVAIGQTMIPLKNDSKRIMIAKQSRPRKAIAEFRKKGRGEHWSAWTGRVGVHVKVDEINIEKLSAEIEKKLPGWYECLI
jgi:hypothetical protein